MSRALDAVQASVLDPARELVAALAARDWERLQTCLAPDVDFHAAIPSQRPLREHLGAEETTAQLAAWFGDAEPLELLEATIEPLADRVHLSYRFAAFEEERWHLVEQHAYATVEGGRIAGLDLVCSGFRPVPERPGR